MSGGKRPAENTRPYPLMEVVNMSKHEVLKTEVSPVQTPEVTTEITTEAIPEVLTPIPECVGIQTALTTIESAKARLENAVRAASSTEVELSKFRAELIAMPSGLMKNHIATHQAELEAEITEGSKKAVSEAIKEVLTHVQTVNTLAAQLNGKYGKPFVTVKMAEKGTGAFGNITDNNKGELSDILKGRGYAPVFTPLEDGVHYQVSLPDGRHNRYTSNVKANWI